MLYSSVPDVSGNMFADRGRTKPESISAPNGNLRMAIWAFALRGRAPTSLKKYGQTPTLKSSSIPTTNGSAHAPASKNAALPRRTRPRPPWRSTRRKRPCRRPASTDATSTRSCWHRFLPITSSRTPPRWSRTISSANRRSASTFPPHAPVSSPPWRSDSPSCAPSRRNTATCWSAVPTSSP